MGHLHDVLPDERRIGATEDLAVGGRRHHRYLALRVAHPDSGRPLRRVSDEERISVVLGGAGLAGGGAILELRPVPGAGIQDTFEYPRQLVGEAGIEDPGLLPLPTPQRCAVGVDHAGDIGGWVVDAPVGEGAVGGGHVEQGGVGGAEDVRVDLLDGRDDPESTAHVGDPLGAHGHRELGIDGVDRAPGGLHKRQPLGFRQLLAQGNIGHAVSRGAAADPPDVVRFDRSGDLELDDVRCLVGGGDLPPGLQRRSQADGLHGGTNLATVADGQVDLGVVVVSEEVTPSDHGEHVAVLRVHDDDRGIRVAAPGRQVPFDGRLGSDLEGQVDGGLYAQATLEQQHLSLGTCGPEGLVVEEPSADLLHEVSGRIAGVEPAGVFLELRWRDPGVSELVGGYEVVGEHAVEHEVAAPEARGVVAQRVEAARCLDETGEHGGLVDGQVPDVFVEIRLGRRLDAVSAVAEVHGVQVLEEDEVLAVLVLEPQCVPDLLELAGGGLLGVFDDRQLDVLLGDRGAALADAARLQVRAGCPDDRLEVDPVVGVEALVLDGDDGVAHELGDFVEAAGAGAVLWSDQGGDQGAVPGHHDRRLGRIGNGDLEGAGLVRVAAGGEQRDDDEDALNPPRMRTGDALLGDMLVHVHSLAASRPEGASADNGSRDERVGFGCFQRQW